MKRILTVALAAAALVALFSLPPFMGLPHVHAQQVVDVGRFLPAVPTGNSITADDTDVAMIVKYIGSSASADVAVAAGGDLTFRDNAVADATFECPVSGALGGIIDVSDAACDTMGEVVDIVNASANWRVVLIDALRSDSSNDTIKTISATEATTAKGLVLNFDTDVAFMVSVSLLPFEYRDSIMPYLEGVQSGNAWNQNPFSGTQSRARLATGFSTYGSGTSLWEVHCRKPKFAQAGSETVVKRWTTAAGATTVRDTLDAVDWGEGVLCDQDAVPLVRIKNSAAAATVQLTAHGAMWRYR